MAETPLVSVIMLTYNHAPWIEEAIHGVLGQRTDFPVELILAEDCSTDGTREIAFEYEHRYPERVRVVTANENVGAHANLRRARKNARGEFVACCEGDDFWNDPTMLQKQVDFLREHPDYGMVHTHANMYVARTKRTKWNVARVPHDVEDDKAYFEILSRRREIVTASVCARKELFDQVFANNPECSSDQFMMADTQCWLELSRLAKVKCLHEPMVTYRSLEESATHSKNPRRLLTFALSIRELKYHYLDKYECPDDIRRHVKRRMSLSVLRRACEASDREWADDAWSDLRELRVPIPLTGRLYYFGSRSEARRRLVQPFLAIDKLTSRGVRKAKRILAGS